jgi:hypothetical protein
MTRSEYESLLRKPAIAKRNPAGGETSGPVVEQRRGHAPHGGGAAQTRHPRKRLVRITCFRARHLQDPDNGVYKWHIDAIRRAGLVDDDTAEAIQLVICPEVKVATLEEERTEIYIEVI